MKRILAVLFLFFMAMAAVQCGRRGTPSGGIKDIIPPKLIKADPPNLSTNFKATKFRLYFDEYIKLEKITDQLIISPPLKNTPEITPQTGARKYIEVIIKDTLTPNTTYTFNFGESIVDNNEGNPNRFLTYVFSTGDYIDSLSLTGVIKDGFNRKADEFVSVMLYEIDSAYTDSTIYKKPPNYITNTLDSNIIFKLNYLKAGKYALAALKDEAKNHVFDQKVDKIGFVTDTITLPTDSTYLLTMFLEEPNYSISVPSIAAKNRILFGYQGKREDIAIETLSVLPDTVQTTITKEREKDSLNYWFTPFEFDSIVFTVTNEKLNIKDTFTVRNRKLPKDTLTIGTNLKGTVDFTSPFQIVANTPLATIDTSKISMMNKDSIPQELAIILDSVKNKIDVGFTREPNQAYKLELLPGAITDFFGTQNDTLNYAVNTGSYADYGNLRLNLSGNVLFPLIAQLTDEKGIVLREQYLTELKMLEFNYLKPAKYQVRVIYDTNENGKWDTGNYLKKIQPEKVGHYPDIIEIRANWEQEYTFILLE